MPKGSKFLYPLILAASLVFLLPRILQPLPNLLDITETWSFRKNIIQNTLSDFSDQNRFRPLYVFERTLLNQILDYRSGLYFLFFAIKLSITIYLIFKISAPNHLSLLTGAMVYILMLVSPVTVDAYWRLGTAENLFVLILLTGVYLILNQRFSLAIPALMLLMLSKENAVFYIPVFLVYILSRRKYLHFLIIFPVYLLYSGKILFLIAKIPENPQTYTALFSGVPASLLDMFSYYLTSQIFYVCLFLTSFTVICYRWINDVQPRKIFRFQNELFIIALIFAGFSSLLFFHNKNQPYYFLPVMTIIVILFSGEITRLKSDWRKYPLGLMMIMFLIFKIPSAAVTTAYFWEKDYVGDGLLVNEIMQNINTRRYAFFSGERPEYQPATDHLYGMFGSQKAKRTVYNIYHADIQNPQGAGKPLCQEIFFLGLYCKWATGPK
jgi:hypothetical protein